MNRLSILHGVLKPVISLGLTASLVIAAPCLSWCDPVAANSPKDAELVASFRSHHDAFEKLAGMGMEDTGILSLLSFEMLNERPLTGGRQALSPERRSEYVRLLTSVRPDLVMGIDFYRISFSYSRGGSGLSIGPGWMKGIAYLPQGYERVGIVVPSLDKPPSEDGVYLVPIEPKWYIIYVQLD
jgi:hypothetical protein